MTNLGQLSFNTTNIDVAVVRTSFNPNANGSPTYQFPSVQTVNNPLNIAGTGDFYQNTPIDYRDPQSAQWNMTIEREILRDVTLRESYVGMNSYRMSQTVDLNQVEPSTISPNPNPKPYPNWGRLLSTNNAGHVSYQGLQSELNVRSLSGLTLQASHVWAKSLGNVGGDAPTTFNPEIIYGTPVANRFNLAANRGNVSQTRRNRLLLSAVYDAPCREKSKIFPRPEPRTGCSVRRVVCKHRESVGNGALSDADDKFELRPRKPEHLLSWRLPAPGLHWQR